MGLSWLRQRDLVLVLVLVMVTSSAIELTGDNVCHRVENYTVTFRESYKEPVIVNTVTWCLQIPPRCPRSRIEMRERWRIKTETRQRKLMDCCKGYVAKTTRGKDDNTSVCEPHCDMCHFGDCVAPNTCECYPGYAGTICAFNCPTGTWGAECLEKCNCRRNEICNNVNGTCTCPRGWRGFNCEEKCPAGKWGLDCANSCRCNKKRKGNESDTPLEARKLSSICHHETGECFDRTAEPLITVMDNSSGGNKINEGTSSTATIAFVPPPSTESTIGNRIESSTSNFDYDNIDTDGESEDDDDVDPEGDRVTTRFPRPADREIVNRDQSVRSPASIEKSLSKISANPVVLEISTIETSSIVTSTVTNKNDNYNGQQRNERIDTKVPRVKKPATPGPIVAVVHVSGNGSPGHDGPMIMTPLGSEKIPTHAVPMPIDIAALIVVGSIISLGLTTLAVLAVLHIRSRLFETIRLSIYDAAEKRDATTNETIRRGVGEKGDNGRISSIGCNSGIIPCEYETPRCIVPEHQTLPRLRPPSSCTDTMKKQESSYANDFANIRLFNNIQELLEAHYDRPPSTFRHAVVDVDGEHVYDEIPLQSSTTFATKRDS